MLAKGTFRVESWQEEPYLEGDRRKLTRATVKQSFAGDLMGEGAVEWLMCYRPDQTADFVGHQFVSGRLGGRRGTFVVRSWGTFDGQQARGTWAVIQGSATGELDGLRGQGEFVAPLGPEASFELDYEIGE